MYVSYVLVVRFLASTAVHHKLGNNLSVHSNYIPSAQLAEHTVAKAPISIEGAVYETTR